MNTYSFQIKLHTLALCAVKDGHTYDAFEFEGMKFNHWEFNFANGHKKAAWLITGETQATSIREVIKSFRQTLNNIIPRIALISQCYAEHLNESFLIHRLDTNIALFRYSKEDTGVPLHFDEESLEALTLLKEANLPNEFFYYWNDMLNTVGYPAKLLLIFSALESLGKALKKGKGEFRKEVLGNDLSKKIFEKDKGIRHRLAHGEYFSDKDGEDYLAQVYEKIIEYFNSIILRKNLIRAVVHPQRHPYGNKKGGTYYLKKKPEYSFDLKEIIKSCDINFSSISEYFDMATDEEIKKL